MQLLLNDDIGGLLDCDSARRFFSEEIMKLSSPVSQRDRFVNYLLTQPAPVLADRLKTLRQEAALV